MTWLQTTPWIFLVLAAACADQVDEPTKESTPDSIDTHSPDSSDSSVDAGLIVSPALTLESQNRPTNILLLTTDTLRRDRFNSNGYTTHTTTPNLDALLAGSVNLTNHHSCASWTYPAFICAYTGRNQLSAGAWPIMQPYEGGEAPMVLPDSFPSFVADLNSQGFQTALITGNQVLRAFGLEAGFDFHVKCPAPDCPVGSEGIAAATTNKAIEVFETFDRNEPWLLQVHYFEPHLPNTPPQRYMEALEPLPICPFPLRNLEEQVAMLNLLAGLENETERQYCQEVAEALYDAEVRFMDDEIGRLLEYAEAQGFWEDTLLVYFSDHGEEYFDHGWWGHGTQNFEEQIAATGAFFQPGNLRPFTVTGPTTIEDIAPTTYALLGLTPSAEFTGIVVNNTQDRVTYQLNYREDTTRHSVTSSTDKLIYTADCSPMQYYDLLVDPQETQNLYAPEHPRVVYLWEKLQSRILELALADPEYTPCGSENW